MSFEYFPFVLGATATPCASCICECGTSCPCISAQNENKLSVSGYGFDMATDDYICVVQLRTDGGEEVEISSARNGATVISYNEIACTIPSLPAGFTAQAANVTVFVDGTTRVAGLFLVEFYPVWVSLDSSTAAANGCVEMTDPCPPESLSIEVSAVGLNLEQEYQCSFRSDGLTLTSDFVQPFEQTSLACTIPPSTVAGLFTVTVADRDGKAVELANDASSADFEYLALVSDMSPRQVNADGSGVITVSGFGFRIGQPETYSCSIESASGQVLYSVAPTSVASDKVMVCDFAGSPPFSGQLAYLKVVSSVGGTTRELDLDESLEGGKLQFAEGWTGAADDSGYAGGQALLLVSGYGFQIGSEDYACNFTSDFGWQLGSVEARSFTELEVKLPIWQYQETQTQIYILKQGTPVAFTGAGPVLFNFTASWDFVESQWSPLAGGGSITLQLHGWVPGYAWTVAVSDTDTASFDVSPDSEGRLTWNADPSTSLFEYVADVTVTRNYDRPDGSADADVHHDGAFDLAYVSEWTGASSSWDVTYGDGTTETLSNVLSSLSDSVEITLTGDGFVTGQQIYYCNFTGAAGGAVSSAKVEATDASTVVCANPGWSLQAGSVYVSLLRDGFTVASEANGADPGLIFAAAVGSVSPLSAPAVGQIFTVHGAGFSSASVYKCSFRSAPGGSSGQDVAASWVSESQLVCGSSTWGALFVIDRAANISIVVLGPNDAPLALSEGVDPLSVQLIPTFGSPNATSGSAKGGESLLFQTSGLDLSLEYECVFEADGLDPAVSAPASPMATSTAAPDVGNTLACVTPRWEHPEGIVSLSVRELVSGLGLHSAGLSFTFTHEVESLHATEGSAMGGMELGISGFGFDTTYVYVCRFVSDEYGYRESESRAPANDTNLACVLPSWPYPETDTTVVLYKVSASSGARSSVPSSGTSAFRYTAVWISKLPDSGSAIGGTSVTVSGYGFLSQVYYYTCVFSTEEHHETEIANVNDPTTLSCKTPMWESAATTVTLEIRRTSEETIMAKAGAANADFEYFAEWSEMVSLTASGTAAGHDEVTIKGGGFNASDSSLYTCAFTDVQENFDPTNAVTWEASPSLTVDSFDQLRCDTPEWGLTRPEGDAYLYLLKDGAIVGMPGDGADAVKFTFTASIAGVLTTIGKASGGTPVVISGFGFDQSASDYRCVFSVGPPGATKVLTVADQTPDNSQNLTCTTGQWLFAEVTTAVTVFRGSNRVALVQGAQNDHAFAAVWSSFTPTAGPSSGGTTVTVTGLGFAPGNAQQCVFKDGQGYEVTGSGAVPAGSSSKLLCTLPMWLGALGVQQLTVARTSPSGPFPAEIEFIGSGSQDFEYYSVWTGLSDTAPTSGPASGGTIVQVAGNGFDQTGATEYACAFTSQSEEDFDPQQSATWVQSANTTVVSSDLIECETDAWGETFGAGVVRMFLVRRGAGDPFGVVERNDASLSVAFEFIARVSGVVGVDPSGPASGGTDVTVQGYGFNTLSNQYSCNFTSLNGSVLTVSGVTPSTPQELVCTTTEWLFGEADTNLTVYYGENAIDASNDASVGFTFLSTWDSHEPSSGPAVGGTTITISGAGFAANALQCVFTMMSQARREAYSETTEAVLSSTSELTCDLPLWTEEVGNVKLSLERVNPDGGLFTQTVDYAGATDSFEYFTVWGGFAEFSPSSGQAGGGTVLAVEGGGFVGSSVFECAFTTLQTGFDPSNAAQWVGSASVTVISHDKLNCTAGAWGATEAASSVFVYLLKDGSIVTKSDGSSSAAFTFIETVRYIDTSRGKANGGETVGVVGYGFDTGDSDYVCEFSNEARSEVTTVSGLSPTNSTYLECGPTPVWGYPEGNTNVSVYHDGGNYILEVLGPLDDDETSSLEYHIGAVWSSFGPTTGPSVGGTIITITGKGFDDSGGQDLIECIFGGSVRVSANITSSSSLICELPVWPNTVGEHALSLERTSSHPVFGIEVEFIGIGGQQFEYYAVWHGLSTSSPTSGPTTGGTTFTIEGSGFTVAEEATYDCAFTNVTSGFDPAISSSWQPSASLSVDSSGAITCVTPRYGDFATAGVAQLYLLKDDGAGTISALSFVNGTLSVDFEFLSAVDAITNNPASGPATGGTTVSLSGYDFDTSASDYSVVFDEGGGGENATGACSASSSSVLECVTSQWLGREGDTTVTVYKGTDLVSTSPGTVLTFGFEASWSSVSPPSSPSSSINLAVSGAGFETANNFYACKLIFAGGDEALLPAQASNKTSITCDVLDWNLAASEVEVQIWRRAAGQAITQLTTQVSYSGDASPNVTVFSILSGTSNPQPSTGVASGSEIITVSGRGFTVDDSKVYSCAFATADSFDLADTNTWVGSNCTAQNYDELECTTGAWGASRAAGTVGMYVLEDGVIIPLISGIEAFDFEFSQDVASMLPAGASAVGGSLLTVLGSGFDTDAGSVYSCHFVGVSLTLESDQVEATSSSELRCTIPRWTAPSEDVSVIVKYNSTLDLPVPGSLSLYHGVESVSPGHCGKLGDSEITVFGAGFKAMADAQYMCSLTSGGITVNSTLVAASHSQVVCQCPFWSNESSVTYTPVAADLALISVPNSGNEELVNEAGSALQVDFVFLNKRPMFEASQVIVDQGIGTFSLWNWTTFQVGAMDDGNEPPDEITQQVTFHVMATPAAFFDVVPYVDACVEDGCRTGNLTFRVKDDIFGEARVIVYAEDDGENVYGSRTSLSQRYTISIRSRPLSPSFNTFTLFDTYENAGTVRSSFKFATDISTGSDNDKTQSITFTVAVANPLLFSVQPEIELSGILAFTTAQNANGQTNASVVATNTAGQVSDAHQFIINISSVNSPPTFGITQGVDMTEDDGCAYENEFAFSMSPGPASSTHDGPCLGAAGYNADLLGCDEEWQTMSFTVYKIEGDYDYVSQASLSNNGTLTLCLKDEYVCPFGTCLTRWGVNLTDDGGYENGGVNQSIFNIEVHSFELTVKYLNDAPSFVIPDENITRLEDSGNYSQASFAVNLSKGEANEAWQNLSFSVSCDAANPDNNCDLFARGPTISSNGDLSFELAPFQHGTALLSATMMDDGGTDLTGVDTSAPHLFLVTVLFINHVPSFDITPSYTLLERSAGEDLRASVPAFATQILPGPPIESDQSISFIITFVEGSTVMFDQEPSISSDGTLNFTVSAYQHGTSKWQAILVDDGGTERNGTNTSEPQNFSITVLSFNQRPVFALPSPIAVASGGVAAVNESAPKNFTLDAPGDVSYVNMSVTVYFHEADAPNLVETRLVTLHDLSTGELSIDEDFASILIKGSSITEANGLYHPIKDMGSNETRYDYIRYGSFETLQFRNLSQSTLGPCASPFWVIDSRDTHEEEYGSVWEVTIEDGGAGYIPGDVIVQNASGSDFLGSFTVVGTSINAARVTLGGRYYGVMENATVVYSGTSIAMDGTITSASSNYSLVVQDSGAHMWGTCSSGGTMMVRAAQGRSTSGSGFTASYSVIDDSLVLDIADGDHGAGFGPDSSDLELYAVEDTCRCGSGISEFELVENPDWEQYKEYATGTVYAVDSALNSVDGSFIGSFDVSGGNFSNLAIDATGGGYTDWPLLEIQFAPDGGQRESCTYSSATGHWHCIRGAVFRIAIGLAVSKCLTPLVAHDASVKAHGDSSLMHICDDGSMAMSPIESSNGWVERNSAGGWDDAASASAVAPVSTASKYTVSSPGNVTLLEDSPAHVATLVTGIYAEPEIDLSSSQSLSFNATLVTGRSGMFVSDPAIDAAGNLSFTLAPDENGIATFEVVAIDDGGTDNNGVPQSWPFDPFYESSWTQGSWACSTIGCANRVSVIATPVNDPPLFHLASDPGTVWEDSGFHSILGAAFNITAGPWDEAWQELTFHVVATQGAYLYEVNATMSPNGTLNFTVRDFEYGISKLDIYLVDDGGVENGGNDTSVVQIYSLDVKYVNHIPTFQAPPNMTIFEDQGHVVDSAFAQQIDPGLPNEAWQNLTFVVEQVSGPTLALIESIPVLHPNGTLVLDTKLNQRGTATYTITLLDDGGTERGGINSSVVADFKLIVLSVNDRPTFELDSHEILVNENTRGTQTIAAFAKQITTGADNEYLQQVTFSMTYHSSDVKAYSTIVDPSLFKVEPSIDAATGDLTFELEEDRYGVATFNVSLSDDGDIDNGGFNISYVTMLNIEAKFVNQIPSFDLFGDVVRDEVIDIAAPDSLDNFALNLSFGPDLELENAQAITYIVTPAAGFESDAALIFETQPAIDASGTLSWTLRPNYDGVVQFVVHAEDDGGTERGGNNRSAAAYFKFTVLYVNNAPTFDVPSVIKVLEDSYRAEWLYFAKNISAGPGREPAQELTFDVQYFSGDETIFLETPSISVDGTLFFQITPNAYGDVVFDIFLKDDGGLVRNGTDVSVPRKITIRILPVNDAPSLSFASSTYTVLQPNTTFTFLQPGFADVSCTRLDDVYERSTQNLSFTVQGACPTELFSECPSLGPDGTLRFGVLENQYGSANFTVYGIDDGAHSERDDEGNSQEGYNTSLTLPFRIVVEYVNRKPTFDVETSFIGGLELLEDQGPYSAGFATAISLGPNNTAERAQTGFFRAVPVGNAASLFSVQPVISWDGISDAANLSFTPGLHQHGTALFNVTLKDTGGVRRGGQDTSDPPTVLNITLASVNDAPRFNLGMARLFVDENSPGLLTFRGFATNITAGAPNEAQQGITFDLNVTEGDTTIFAVEPGIDSSTGELTFQLAQNRYGNVSFNVTLKDDGVTANGGRTVSNVAELEIIVEFVNQAPQFDLVGNVVTNEAIDLSSEETRMNFAVNVTTGPSIELENVQNVSFQIVARTAQDQAAATVLFAEPPTINASGTLKWRLSPNRFGVVDFLVYAMDDGGIYHGGVDTSTPRRFKFEALYVNNAPVFTLQPLLLLNEDDPTRLHTVATAVGAPTANTGEPAQLLTFTVTVDDAGQHLFAESPIIMSNGSLVVRLARDENGEATLNVTLTDDGGTLRGGKNSTGPKQILVRVLPVNDPPTFDVSGPKVWWENVPPTPGFVEYADTRSNRAPFWQQKSFLVLRGGSHVVDLGFASNISSGPLNEANQTLSFQVSLMGGTASMFETMPWVSAVNGSLQFTTSSSYYDDTNQMTSAFSVRLVDSETKHRTSLQGVNFTVEVSPALAEFDVVLDKPASDAELEALRLRIAEQLGVDPLFVLLVPTSVRRSSSRRLLSVSYRFVIKATTVEKASFIQQRLFTGINLEGFSGAYVDATTLRAWASNKEFAEATYTITAPNGTVSVGGAATNAVYSIPLVEVGSAGAEVQIALDGNQLVTFHTLHVSNPLLFLSFPVITSEGMLEFQLAPDTAGVSQISIQLLADAGTVASVDPLGEQSNFTIIALPVNSPPSFRLPWRAACVDATSVDCPCSTLGFYGSTFCGPVTESGSEGELLDGAADVTVVQGSGSHRVHNFTGGVAAADGYMQASLTVVSVQGTTTLLPGSRLMQDAHELTPGLDYMTQIAYSPDGKHAYAAEFASDSISAWVVPDEWPSSLEFVERIREGGSRVRLSSSAEVGTSALCGTEGFAAEGSSWMVLSSGCEMVASHELAIADQASRKLDIPGSSECRGQDTLEACRDLLQSPPQFLWAHTKGMWEFSERRFSGKYTRDAATIADGCDELDSTLIVSPSNVEDLSGVMGDAVLRGPSCKEGTDWDAPAGEASLSLTTFAMGDGLGSEAMQVDGTLNTGLYVSHDSAGLAAQGKMPKAAISVEAWVVIEKEDGFSGIASAAQSGGGYFRGWLLGYTVKSGIITFFWSLSSSGSNKRNTLPFECSTADCEPGKWIHLVATYNGESSLLYVNGVATTPYRVCDDGLASCGPITYPMPPEAPSDATPFSIGSYDNAATGLVQSHVGAIAMLRIYDVALDHSNVTLSRSLKAGLFARPLQSDAYWAASTGASPSPTPLVHDAHSVGTVTIRGKFPLSAYRCSFAYRDARELTEATVVSDNTLTCPTPVWKYGLKAATLAVVETVSGRPLWLRICLRDSCGFKPRGDERVATPNWWNNINLLGLPDVKGSVARVTFTTPSLVYSIGAGGSLTESLTLGDGLGAAKHTYFDASGNHFLLAANYWDGLNFAVSSSLWELTTLSSSPSANRTQEIPTEGATQWAACNVSGNDGNSKLLLAVSNFDGASAVYEWDAHASRVNLNSKRLLAEGVHGAAGVSCFDSPSGEGGPLLALSVYLDETGLSHSTHSHLLRWNGTRFAPFQSFVTVGARGAQHHVFGNKHILLFACERGNESPVYVWDSVTAHQFVLLQAIPTRGATASTRYSAYGNIFLAVAESSPCSTIREEVEHPQCSTVYRWNGTMLIGVSSVSDRFGEAGGGQQLPTRLAQGVVGLSRFDLNDTAVGAFLFAANFEEELNTSASMNASGGTVAVQDVQSEVFSASFERFENVLKGPSSIAVSLDGVHVYVATAVDDSVSIFTRNHHTGRLTASSSFQVASWGLFPGNLRPHTWVTSMQFVRARDGTEVMYITSAFPGSIHVLTRDNTTGGLEQQQVVSDGDQGGFVDGLGGAMSASLSPEGTLLYVSAYTDSALSEFEVAPNGTLTYADRLQVRNRFHNSTTDMFLLKPQCHYFHSEI